MIYSSEQIEKIVNYFKKELIKANQQNELEEFLSRHDFDEILDEPSCDFNYLTNINRAKIAIISYKIKNKKDIKLFLKKNYKIPEDRIEFIETNNGFNINSIQYTNKFSDLLIGPVPHKLEGVSSSSLIAEIENNSYMYPKMQKIVDSNGVLSLSISAIGKLIKKTNFYNDGIYIM